MGSRAWQTKLKIPTAAKQKPKSLTQHDDDDANNNEKIMMTRNEKKLCFKPVSNWELLWGSVTFCVGFFLFLLVFCFCQFRYHKPNKRCCFFFLRVSGRFSVSTTTTPPTARNGGHKFALPYTQTKTSFKDFYRENIWNFFFGIIFSLKINDTFTNFF